jgi:glycosyltransferase involved in cell wall biosynthesis
MKKLARQLDKSGIKVKCHAEDLLTVDHTITRFKPDILHIHYHPDSKKIRHAMRAAEGLGIPVVITFHEVLRVPAERVAHVQKCIARCRYGFFLTEADRDAALAVNPRLANASEIHAIPAPTQLPDEIFSDRTRVQENFLTHDTPETNILWLHSILPECGVEYVLDATSAFPKGIRLTLAGTVPPGEGGYAKFIKAKVAYEQLPVDLAISKRVIGKKQLMELMQGKLFAYVPDGDPRAKGYSGITGHHLLVPFLNAAQMLVFAHRGVYTAESMAYAVDWIKKPQEMAQAIRAYHKQPESLQRRLMEAAEYAGRMTWAELARQTIASYKQAISAR